MKQVLCLVCIITLFVSCKKDKLEEISPSITLTQSSDYPDRTMRTSGVKDQFSEWTIKVKGSPVMMMPTVYFTDDGVYPMNNYLLLKSVYLMIEDVSTNKLNPTSSGAQPFNSVKLQSDGTYKVRLYASPGQNFYGFLVTSKLQISYQWMNSSSSQIASTPVVEGNTMKLE